MPDNLKNSTVLRAYQRRWANDPARLALAVKAAQTGYSTASAAWAVVLALLRPKQLIVLLSRSERQSLELAEKCKAWVDGYQGVMADFYPRQTFAPVSGVGGQVADPNPRHLTPATSLLQHEIRFPNRSRIIALAANPDTARGYTGHVVLDEFAFHADADAIFKSAYRQTTLGFKLRVVSTPNGQRGKFWELAKELGLDLGVRPQRQPVRQVSGVGGQRSGADTRNLAPGTSPWSGHWCDIYLAVEEGLGLKPQEVRAGCDEETWLQEYCCQFISQASQWISPELFQQCVSREASTSQEVSSQEPGARSSSSDFRLLASGSLLYAGWDIARRRDLSVIWISELVGDVTWTRGVIELSRMNTVDQVREARALLGAGAAMSALSEAEGSSSFPSSPRRRGPMDSRLRGNDVQGQTPPQITRMNIDMSGMGLAIYEQLAREFPDRVEGVEFTAAVKERLAVLARRRMEEGKVRLPEDENVRRAFGAVRKTVNSIGQARFDAEHDSRTGHADAFWAFALAEAAADARAARTPSLEQGFFAGTPRAAAILPGEMPARF